MIPKGLIMELIDHPWFQRLRRIKQLGLSHFVYPGAVHTRFHHALGAFHLMTRSLEILKLKGLIISKEEFEAAQIAALLHDIGHGPFSHVLEHSLVPVDHEIMTLEIMKELNQQFDQKLSLAIAIFTGNYDKSYLCQLVSSQLDVDRMDYLNRDSFYSGVAEGTIGYDRMLTMMDVVDNQLVFEEKVALSVENYLAARRLMYWQVYMHKTSLAAEHMLEVLLKCCKQLPASKISDYGLNYFLHLPEGFQPEQDHDQLLSFYQNIDDSDIEVFLKTCVNFEDPMIVYLAKNLLSRKFFKIKIQSQAFNESELQAYRDACCRLFPISNKQSEWIISQNKLEFCAYEFGKTELKIRTKTNAIKNLSEIINLENYIRSENKYFIAIPREVLDYSK